MTETAEKFDDNKLRTDLMPPEIQMLIDHVFTIGAAKYADDNWKKGFDWKRVKAAMKRHIQFWELGETLDPDGQHHLASVAWCAIVLMYFEMYGIGKDDVRQNLSAVVKGIYKLGLNPETFFPGRGF